MNAKVKIKKTKNIVTSVVFSAFILIVTLACVFHAPNDISNSERRPLAQFPKFELTALGFNASVKEYISDFEDYTLDQFPLRDTMRSIKAFVEFKLFGKTDNNQIYEVDEFISEMAPELNKESMDKAVNSWNDIYKNYLEGKANKVILSVIPDKNYFMAEANGYPAYDYEAMIKELKEKCPDFEYVDIFGELELEDYYKTDTHWRQEKIVEVAKKLAQAFGVYDEYDWDNYGEDNLNTLDIPFFGVYAGRLGLSVDGETIYYFTNDVINGCTVFESFYDMNKGEYSWITSQMYNEALAKENYQTGKDPYDFFLSGAKKEPMKIVNPAQTNGKELVIFRDSFGSSISPLLLEGYSTVYAVDTRVISVDQIDEIVGGFEGKDVLFLSSSMVING